MKKILTLLMATMMMLSLLAACGDKQPISDSSQEQKEEIVVDEASKEAQKSYKRSTSSNDTDIGLRNVKIDDAQQNLTEEQRLVRKYFDRDYFYIRFYDDLQRYPDAYDGTQIYFYGTVEKIIKSDSTGYECLVRMWDSNEDDLIHMIGKQSKTRIIQGDMICVYGRYNGINTYTIDGKSYSIPSVNSYDATFSENDYTLPERYDLADIKQIASFVFGEDIEVRNPNNENEQGSTLFLDGNWDLKNNYIVELDNQSNAKFGKYRFYTQAGYIQTIEDENSTIKRNIEFTQDNEHFLVISYDWQLKTVSVEYYTSDLEKVWRRDFENITCLTSEYKAYDYTKNNFYIVAANKMYIIDMKTGEDVFAPTYVSDKAEIRKLSNGIFAVSQDETDSVMFMDLKGNILWTTNIPECLGISGVSSVHVVDEKIVTQASFIRELDHILVINKDTGELILDCKPSVYFN